MKKLNLILLFICMIFIAYSQPSKSAMIAKIKSSENYISVKLLGLGYDKKYENGSWHYYFQQDFATRRRSKKCLIKFSRGKYRDSWMPNVQLKKTN